VRFAGGYASPPTDRIGVVARMPRTPPTAVLTGVMVVVVVVVVAVV